MQRTLHANPDWICEHISLEKSARKVLPYLEVRGQVGLDLFDDG